MLANEWVMDIMLLGVCYVYVFVIILVSGKTFKHLDFQASIHESSYIL